MMYSDKFVACIKVDGKILRENKDVVAIPFGSEYSILLKNLSTVRAQARVHIDGTSTTEDSWLILAPGGEVELERYIRNGNLDRGNRFKFIERTAAIENGPRGIKIEDGIVRVEFKFEKVRITPPSFPIFRDDYDFHNEFWRKQRIGGTRLGRSLSDEPEERSRSFSPTRSMTKGGGGAIRPQGMRSFSAMDDDGPAQFLDDSLGVECSAAGASNYMKSAAPVNENGITVAGSESRQQFREGAWFPTEFMTHSIVFKLVGAVEGKVIEKAVTVQHKPKCGTCGKVNKATNKFCAECGTSLVLY